MPLRIGVLALQGNYQQHLNLFINISENRYSLDPNFQHLAQTALTCFPIHSRSDLANIDALVLPGGESGTMRKLLRVQGLTGDLHALITGGIPVLATCAGCILLAEKVYCNGIQELSSPLASCPIALERNAYGRQLHSFYATTVCSDAKLRKLAIQTLRGLFIRAPKLLSSTDDTRVLFTHHDEPVVLQYKQMLLCTFHPEAVDDTTLHLLFLQNILTMHH